jgi:hypothetical protein
LAKRAATVLLATLAAIAALAATGIAHLPLVSTPRPMAYLGWIVGLATAAAAFPRDRRRGVRSPPPSRGGVVWDGPAIGSLSSPAPPTRARGHSPTTSALSALRRGMPREAPIRFAESPRALRPWASVVC